MVEFKRIYGNRASLSRAVLARISHSNKLPLQRRSKQLNHCTVAAVLEEATRIFGTESRDRRAYRLEQSLPTTGLGFAQDALYLAECLLDRIKVW
jgi:hypothetical protein